VTVDFQFSASDTARGTDRSLIVAAPLLKAANQENGFSWVSSSMDEGRRKTASRELPFDERLQFGFG